MMYATLLRGRFKTGYLSLAAYHLPASPGWEDVLEPQTVRQILSELQNIRIRSFLWNVRFDHRALAACLESSGLRPEITSTHVLYLDRPYAEVFGEYSASTRNHIRKGQRRGLIIREAYLPEDAHAYYEVYMQLVQLKQQREGYGYIYPVEFFIELAKLYSLVLFLVAVWEGRIVGGGIFIRDGSSIRFFHGASDRSYSHLFPLAGVLDQAIRWGYESNADSFNFGGSAGIASLEHFKASWGARQETEWRFEWSNPLWHRLSHLTTNFKERLARQNPIAARSRPLY